MAYYPTPTNNDTQGIYEYFNYVNNVADGLFFPVIIFVIWFISFFAIKQYSTSRAWTFASFFCSILAMTLTVLNLINSKFMYAFFIATVIGFVWLKLESQ